MNHIPGPLRPLRLSARATRVVLGAASMAAVLAGCANPALTQVSPNQYRIVKSDRMHFYRTTAELKADAVKEADDYAVARGMLALPIATSEQPLVPGVEFASVRYVFRLVDKSDPQARRGMVTVMPITLDKAEGPGSAASAAADIAALDEMRERGVISPLEFRTLKARLLAPPGDGVAAPAVVAETQPVKP